MNLAYWLNSAWMVRCRREARAFARATRAVAKTQWTILEKIVTANANSEFGRQHQFGSIRSVSHFQQRVPIATPDQFTAAIQEIATGRDNVLTCEPVELLEPTSGNTAGERLVPYTASLRRQFQRAVACWVFDAMKNQPGIRRGRAYWSISPAMGPRRISSGGIPIGFDDDAAYLSTMERCFLTHLLVMPHGIANLTSIENFRYCTLLHLLAAGDLSLISVWSPTFLTSLLAQIEPWQDGLVEDLQTRRATLPIADDGGHSEATLSIRCSANRATEVKHHLQMNGSLSSMLGQLWPQLDLISCWADGNASNYIGRIREYFPTVNVQPKGLMSTEACVSFPLVGHRGAALALRSHFFEFVPVDSTGTQGEPHPAHSVNEGKRYEVIVTTGGGLYRYRTGDVVEVVGLLNECPFLRFVGRTGRVCDVVGEKLSESHVSHTVREVCERHEIECQFAMVVPVPDRLRYRLYLEVNHAERVHSGMARIRNDLQSGLNENPHYRYATDLRQLHPLEICVVESERPTLWPIYERVLLERGQRAGDIKPMALDSWVGWHQEFKAATNSAQSVGRTT